MSRSLNEDFAREVGERIRTARSRLGLSQEQLAKMADLHRGTIYLIEAGPRVPSAATLLMIGCALDLPLDDILAGIRCVPGRRNGEGKWRLDR